MPPDDYDRARDDIAVPDPYAVEFETARTHGFIKPEDVFIKPEDVPAPSAGTPLNAPIAGVERPAGAPGPWLTSPTARGLAGTPTDL